MIYSQSYSLCLAIFALLATGLAGSAVAAANTSIRLENSHVLLEIDPALGTICRILDKSSGIDLASTPALAENFRLVLLMPDKTTATIMGRDQKLSGVSRTPDGLALSWNGPLKDTAGAEHKIAVRMDVKAVGNELQFGLHLDNGTNGKVKEAWYPMIGGLTKFGDRESRLTACSGFQPPVRRSRRSNCRSARPLSPTRASKHVVHLRAKRGGQEVALLCVHEELARYKVYHFEEHVKDSVKDVFACIQHLPFTPPGKAFDGSTVVLGVIDGDWHAAGRVYRAWFEKTFGITKPSQCWIRRVLLRRYDVRAARGHDQLPISRHPAVGQGCEGPRH